MPHNVLATAGLVAASFICNLPLGRWRASVRKFSALWFLAVHLSIPLIVYIRIELGLNIWFIPFSLGAAVAGQLIGGSSGGSDENPGQNEG